MTYPIKRFTLRLYEIGWPKPITWWAMARPKTKKPMKAAAPYSLGPIKAKGRLEALDIFAKEVEPYNAVLIDVVTTAELLRTRYRWNWVLGDWVPDRDRNDEPPMARVQ